MLALLTTQELAEHLARFVVARRKSQRLTQDELAKRSGVSLGSVRRFEQNGEISLASLLQLLTVLGEADRLVRAFDQDETTFHSIQDVIDSQAKRS